MTQRSAWCSPCTISLEATLGGRPAAGKAQERTLESDCRALPTLLCPEHLQDFVVQAFLELIQLTVYMTNGQLVALHKAYLKCPL